MALQNERLTVFLFNINWTEPANSIIMENALQQAWVMRFTGGSKSSSETKEWDFVRKTEYSKPLKKLTGIIQSVQRTRDNNSIP